MNIYLDLFLTFFKIGLFTFGGGYAMLALIENNCVSLKKWITSDEMLQITVVAESTPGPIAINCATYVGHKKGGFFGAVLATLGVVSPSFIIIYAISLFFENFLEITIIANAIKGVQAAVGLLIISVAWGMLKKMKKELFPVAVMWISFAVILLTNLFSLKLSPVILIILFGVMSFVRFLIRKKGEGKK